jgi:uncharacterized protein YndB with AHSA1/START domain
MRLSQTVTIAAPLATVWRLIDDQDELRRWIPQIVATEIQGDPTAPHHVGQRFKQTFKHGQIERRYQGQVIQYEPQRVFGVHVIEASLTGDVIYRLSTINGATQVDVSADVRMTSFFARAASAAATPVLNVVVGKLLDRLKRVAEAQT